MTTRKRLSSLNELEPFIPDGQPTAIRASTADIPLTTCVCNLGVMSSGNIALDKHISNVCRSAYVEIRHTSSVYQFNKPTKTLVSAFVLSKLDC